MNFLNLHYFLVTAEEMSITKAAGRLYISQQALSAHILNLEKEFGVPLFSRAPAFSLTYAGKCLVAAGKEIMEIRRRLDGQMDEIVGELRGELRIGISYTRGQALLPYVLPKFIEKYPRMEITLREGSTEVLDELLQRGDIDLVLSTDTILPGIAETIALAEERIFLIVPERLLKELYGADAAAYSAAFCAGVKLSEFKTCPFIMLKRGDRVRTVLDEALSREGVTPNILLETDNIQTAFALSGMGMGVTAYPEMFLNSAFTLFPSRLSSNVERFPIEGLPTETLYVGSKRFMRLTPAASAFILEMQQLLSSGAVG